MINGRGVTACIALAVVGILAWLAWRSSGDDRAAPVTVATWGDDDIAETDAPSDTAASASIEDGFAREEVEPDRDIVEGPGLAAGSQRARIIGRIVTGDGRPVAEARIQLHLSATDTLSRRARKVKQDSVADVDGRFAFEGPAPRGAKLYFRAAHPAFAPLLADPGIELAPDGEVTDVGDLVLSRGAALRGRAEDPAGRAVPSATAELRLQHRGPLGELAKQDVRKVECDGAGTFYVDRLPPGAYLVRARAPGYESSTLRNRPRLREGDDTDVGALVLQPGVVVAGRVLDARGEPVYRASVRMSVRKAKRNRRSKLARTDREGKFELPYSPSGEEYEFVISAKGFLYLNETITPSRRDLGRLVFRLVDGLVITGTVYDADDGTPLEQYAIRAERTGRLPSQPSRAGGAVDDKARVRELERQRRKIRRRAPRAGGVASHPRGVFRISGLDEGTYRLILASPDHATLATDLMELDRAQPVRTRDLSLSRGIRVSGSAVAGPKDRPLEGVRLDLLGAPTDSAPKPPGVRPTGPRIATAKSASDGSFAFGRVAPGRYVVTARSNGRTEAWTEPLMLNADRTGLRLELPEAGTVRGTVLGAQAADGGGGISIIAFPIERAGRTAIATASEDGSYSITTLQPGRYFLNAFLGSAGDHMREYTGLGRRSDVQAPATAVQLDIRSGDQHRIDLELEVPARGGLAGTVLHNGQPARSTIVQLRKPTSGQGQQQGRRVTQTRTSADGTFEMKDLAAERYELIVRHPESSRTELHREAVVVPDGGTLRLSITCASARVHGRVRADGPADALRGLVVFLPGASQVPKSLRDYQRQHRVHRVRILGGHFDAKGITVGPALAVVRISGRAETAQSVWIREGETELELSAGAVTPGK